MSPRVTTDIKMNFMMRLRGPQQLHAVGNARLSVYEIAVP